MNYARKVKKLLRVIGVHSPACIHIIVSKYMIKRTRKHLMNSLDVYSVLKNEANKSVMIEKYSRKWPKQARLLEQCIEAKGITDKEMISDASFSFFAYGLTPEEYLWQGGHIDIDNYVSNVDRECFRFSVNDILERGCSDKADIYELLADLYRRDLICIRNKKNRKEYMDFIAKHPVYVEKPVNLSRGDGVRIIDTQIEGFDKEAEFKRITSQDKTLIEEKIEQSDDMAEFNYSSVNTVRMAAFKTRKGIICPWAVLRTGRKGSYVDNAGAGGVLAVIDTAKGIVKTCGYDEFGNTYENHPDSSKRFEGFELPEWENAVNLCIEASKRTPESIKYLSWDLAHTDDGWCIVEVNQSGEFLWQAERGCRNELREIIKDMDQIVKFEI